MMLRAVVAALVLAVTTVGDVYAGEAEDLAYKAFVDRALEHPLEVDYIAFRAVYVASSFYRKRDSDAMAAWGNRLSEENAWPFVTNNFPLLSTQVIATDPSLVREGSDAWQLHIDAGRAIMETLLHTYDVRHRETAIPVLVPSEEEVIASFLRLEIESRDSEVHNGRSYDVFRGTAQLGKRVELWFETTSFQ